MVSSYLEHHGIKGQRWGVRRYQNPDGSLTEAGLRRLEKKDTKWALRNEDRIKGKAYKQVKGDMNRFTKELNRYFPGKQRSSRTYMNYYNQKLAELMNTTTSSLPKSPSGKEIKFVAKRGEMGVYTALATAGYDMSSLKRGVWSDGRTAYQTSYVDQIKRTE